MNQVKIFYRKGTPSSVPFHFRDIADGLLLDQQVIHREGAIGNGEGSLENSHAAL